MKRCARGFETPSPGSRCWTPSRARRRLRAHLFAKPYDWLLTNVRLEAYNGLNLAYLAVSARLPLRVLVDGERQDHALAREARRLGAFFESRHSISLTLASYVGRTLPQRDRRDAGHCDRRHIFRGGRRGADGAPVV